MTRRSDRPYFSPEGYLEDPSGVSLATSLEFLEEQLGLLVLHVETYAKTPDGDYRVGNSSRGPESELGILRQQVLLASPWSRLSLPLTEREQKVIDEIGSCFELENRFLPPDVPLSGLLERVSLAILSNVEDENEGVIKRRNIEQLRAIQVAISANRRARAAAHGAVHADAAEPAAREVAKTPAEHSPVNDTRHEDRAGPLFSWDLAQPPHVKSTTLTLRLKQGAGRKPIVHVLRGKGQIDLAELVLRHADRSLSWREILESRLQAGFTRVTVAESFRRTGNRILDKLPPALAGFWHQDMCGVTWRGPQADCP